MTLYIQEKMQGPYDAYNSKNAQNNLDYEPSDKRCTQEVKAEEY
jgi:hypothetical protein